MPRKRKKTGRKTSRPAKIRRKASRIYRAFPMERSSAPPPVDLPPISSLRRMEEQFEMALPRPKVSVVIVNRDGVDFLWNCLFAVKTQTYPIHEIILVDNASQDASVNFVKTNYPQVKILECQENFGRAMGTNLGAKTATGDLVALVDIQAVVKPDWLALMVGDFRKNWPRFGVLSTPFDEKQGNPVLAPGGSSTLNFLGSRVEGFLEHPQA